MMAARKRMKSKASCYVISKSIEDLKRDTDNCIAKVNAVCRRWECGGSVLHGVVLEEHRENLKRDTDNCIATLNGVLHNYIRTSSAILITALQR